jgi:lipoprotein NlpI
MAKKEAEMFHKQAMSFLGQGKVQKAIEFFDKALNFDDDYFPAWNNKGIALLELKEYRQALDCFNQVIRINPLDRMVWYNKGYTLLFLEEYDESVKAFGNFISTYSKKDDDFYKFALYLQARGFYGLKEYDKALELTQNALKIDENFMEAQELLDLVLKEIEKKE